MAPGMVPSLAAAATRAALLLWAVLCLTASQAASIHVLEVAPDAAPSFVAESASAPRFVVGIAGEAPPEEPRGRPLVMTDANGTRYTCYLPQDPNQADQETAALAAEQALQASKTPDELLDGLTGWCGLHVEGWWTYEVCYKKAARQFHKEGAAAVDQYALGNFTAGGADPNEVLVDASEVGGAVKYVRQLYSGGEKCSLTGEERSVEVRYACAAAGQTRITSLREPRSCAYVLTVATPRLCKHPAFQSEPPVVVAIGCYAQGAAGAAEGGGGGERAACAAGKDFEGGACAAAGGGSEEDVELTEGLGEGEEEEGPGLAGAALAANSSASVDGEVPDEGEEDADGVGLNAFVGGGGGDEYDDYYD